MENTLLVSNQDKVLTDLCCCEVAVLTWKRPVSCSGVFMPLVCPGLGGSGLKRQKKKTSMAVSAANICLY